MRMHCPDGPGIVHFVSGLVAKKLAGNITSTQELILSDERGGRQRKEFFLRVAWETGRGSDKKEVESFFRENLKPYKAEFSVDDAEKRDRLALFATRETHCLIEVLSAHFQAEMFKVKFRHVPYDGKFNAQKKTAAINEQLGILKEHGIDVVGLARYMQIIPPQIIARFKNRVINIHHSFLPAFAGARPYHQAYERGVKKIGATAHFVTANLDEGPIIEQDTEEVVDQSSAEKYIETGRGIEKRVFLGALKKYLERKLIVYGNKVVVFT